MKKEYEPLPAELIDSFQQYDWPGNIRELSGRVYELVATGSRKSANGTVSNGVAPAFRAKSATSDDENAGSRSELSENQFMSLTEARRRALEQAEKSLIEDTLQYTLWNRRKAAKLLDTSYSSILRRIAKYNIGKQ